jgi:hypothetical protein
MNTRAINMVRDCNSFAENEYLYSPAYSSFFAEKKLGIHKSDLFCFIFFYNQYHIYL